VDNDLYEPFRHCNATERHTSVEEQVGEERRTFRIFPFLELEDHPVACGDGLQQDQYAESDVTLVELAPQLDGDGGGEPFASVAGDYSASEIPTEDPDYDKVDYDKVDCDEFLAIHAAEELAGFIRRRPGWPGSARGAKRTYTNCSGECLVRGYHVGFQNGDGDSVNILKRCGERRYKLAVVDTAERQRKRFKLGFLRDERACGDGIGRRPWNNPTRSRGRNDCVGSTLESSGTLRDWDERCTMLGPRICHRCQVPLDNDEDLFICCIRFRRLCWVCFGSCFRCAMSFCHNFCPCICRVGALDHGTIDVNENEVRWYECENCGMPTPNASRPHCDLALCNLCESRGVKCGCYVFPDENNETIQ